MYNVPPEIAGSVTLIKVSLSVQCIQLKQIYKVPEKSERCIAICFRCIIFGYILLAVGKKKDKKKLVNVALKMKGVGVKICDKAFILTFIFLFLMEK